MSAVRDILVKKGSGVLTTGKDSTVLEAAILMNEHKVGALVVLEAGRIAGMFTERDVLRRVVGDVLPCPWVISLGIGAGNSGPGGSMIGASAGGMGGIIGQGGEPGGVSPRRSGRSRIVTSLSASKIRPSAKVNWAITRTRGVVG